MSAQQNRGRHSPRDLDTATTGRCDRCGKIGYPSRRAAKTASRRIPHGGHLSTYECPHSGGQRFHLGHLPDAVKHGDVGRDDYTDRTRAKAVYAQAVSVGAPLTVTFTDPRDGARVVDALLAAADGGVGVEARHWRRIAGRLGDALDRTPVPDWVNDSDKPET